MKFRNKISDEILFHMDFVMFVWEETERQFDECSGELWCNLTKEEQIGLYCQQYEYQLNVRDWEMVCDDNN